MASINFRIKGKTNPGNIRIRLKQGDKFDYEISTGLRSRLEHWSKPKQKVKNLVIATYKDYVNNNLNNLKAFVESEYFKELALGREVSQKWLKDKVNEYFERPDSKDNEKDIYLIAFAENLIKGSKNKINHKTGKRISNRTIDYYEMTVNKLKGFEKIKGRKTKFKDIDLKFHGAFIDFLSEEHHLNPNTIGFYMSKIKLFCREAERKGIKVNLQFKSPYFYIPSNKTTDIYLTIDEINSIYKLDFPSNSRLDNVRDWLIIGLWTGLRVSDLLNLSKNDIEDSFINITNIKTGIPVIIPLHDQVKNILDKRNWSFPKHISNQKFNDYIKKVCELAGIDKMVDGAKMVGKDVNGKKIFRKAFGKYPKHELVSSHICRRSFATNHYGKLDTLTIMKITGHKTEKQFLEYIKITPKEHAVKLNDFWKKQNAKNDN